MSRPGWRIAPAKRISAKSRPSSTRASGSRSLPGFDLCPRLWLIAARHRTPGNLALTASQPAPRNSYRNGPDEFGRFGMFGGRFVAETLMPLILEVEKAYRTAKADPKFADEMEYYRKHYIGRPSPLYFAPRLTEHFGGAKIYLKRDELNHTGSHQIDRESTR